MPTDAPVKRFGIELELSGDLGRALEALQATGLNVIDGRHSHIGFNPTAWTVKRDGTVQSGGEIVSPPLNFSDPAEREQVTIAVQALQDAGMQPHETAGIHIHIEAKQFDGTDMTARQIAAVVRFTYKFEDAIYRIASSGWEKIRSGASGFAGPIPEATARAIMEVKTMAELEAVWDGQTIQRGRRQREQYGRNTRRHLDRYHGTNLRSLIGGYGTKGTIEFRYFNSSVNPVRVQSYIALCMAIVDDARHGFSRSVTKSYRLGAMARGEVKPAALMLRLQQILRSESRDTKVLMSCEDWKNLRKVCWNGSLPQVTI